VAELVVRNLSRRFRSGGGIDRVSIAVEKGEFFVLVGPSGCGKSTLLRLVAGLERADSGEVEIGGRPAGYGADSREAVAMVFQNYALYPHMTAFENIAFPLRLRHVARGEVERRVSASARQAGLDIALDRHPGALSGGERQRVALARALVREPRVILMDEPLSSLDAQLRASLRVELREFQRRTGRTFLYVTHDQLEALTLADRLAVMRSGRIEQVGAPREVYERPANEFVASFIGQPPMNLIRARVAADRMALSIDGFDLAIPPPPGARDELTIGIRPEDFAMDRRDSTVEIETAIEAVEFSGARFLIRARLGNFALTIESGERLLPGERRTFHVDRAKLHFFDPATGMRLS
jgi:ABC-type sugar transport system ATPase subunit